MRNKRKDKQMQQGKYAKDINIPCIMRISLYIPPVTPALTVNCSSTYPVPKTQGIPCAFDPGLILSLTLSPDSHQNYIGSFHSPSRYGRQTLR